MNSEFEDPEVQLRAKFHEERRIKEQQDREVESKLVKAAYRAQVPFRIVLVTVILIVILGVSFKLPMLGGGGLYLVWFIMCIAFVTGLCMRPLFLRWWNRRKKILEDPPTKTIQ